MATAAAAQLWGRMTRAFDAEIRRVQSMLDADYAEEGETSERDAETRERVQAILDAHAGG